MAFDDLIVHPETMMMDADAVRRPCAGEFRPSVSAATSRRGRALQLSLNLPAVAPFDQVGPSRFAQKFNDAGAPLHLPKGEGGQVCRSRLAVGRQFGRASYTVQRPAEKGTARPLNYRAESTAAPGKQLLSPVAAYYLSSILRIISAAAAMVCGGNRKHAANIAYKTGTSYGYRDAWAIGYNSGYTVGVCGGRPMEHSPGRIGRESAAPILFEIFDQLPEADPAFRIPLPDGAITGGTNDLPANLRAFRGETKSGKRLWRREVLGGPVIRESGRRRHRRSRDHRAQPGAPGRPRRSTAALVGQ